MKNPTPLVRPELTLPERKTKALQAACSVARCILEYGSGGATVLAAEKPGKRVTFVERDEAWSRMMNDGFEQNSPTTGTTVRISCFDIGPTGKWGHPKDAEQCLRYARYPLLPIEALTDVIDMMTRP